MAGWSELEREAPEIAAAARRRLVGDDGIALAFLATARPDGVPHLSPVCPVFGEGDLYLCASDGTPKVRDLREGRAFVLHAMLGPDDEEVQLGGVATEVVDAAAREAVHAAIPFAAFDRDDPIFRLAVDRALWVHWERVGQPDTHAVRRRWRAGAPGGAAPFG